MSQSEPKVLIQAKQFIKEGKFKDSLQLLKDFEERRNNSLHDIVSCHLIKCTLLLHQGLFKKAAKFAEQTYRESLGLEKSILSVDALIFMASALIDSFNVKPANKIIKQAEELLATLTEELVINKNRREAHIFHLKGMISDPFYFPKGDVELALKYYKHSLALGESLGDERMVCTNLLGIAWALVTCKGEIDKGLEYVERTLAFSKEANYKLFISWGLLQKASFYNIKGEVTRSISLFEQSLAIAKELNHKQLISSNLNNMADVYRKIGELDHALECSEQSLAQISKIGNLKRVCNSHDFLIQILIEKGDLEQAQQYFNHLEQLNNQLKDKTINLVYLYNKALILKESQRISNRGKAEEILKQILEVEDIQMELNERVLLALCELLLLELQMTDGLEVLEEVESYIARLLDIAEKSHSYWIWGETYLLQAKLALISLNLKEARQLLIQGQQVAEKYGLKMLARKISNEHDELLKQLSLWDNLKESKAPLAERMKLARLNEQIEGMLMKRAIEIPDLSEETPMLLLIVSEGGRPFFSQTFIEDQSFEDHLFAGFLSAINSFMDEMFSEGLDRAVFGEHTLLMNSVSPFFICYIFKGQSYSAQHRIKSFIDKLQRDKDVWDTFEKFYQMNKEIQLKDVPSLEPLIKEIFIDRKILVMQ